MFLTSPFRALSQLINRKLPLLAMCVLALGLMLAPSVANADAPPYLLSITPDSRLTHETSGDGNGEIEPGESGEIGFRVTNQASERMHFNFAHVWSVDSSYVTGYTYDGESVWYPGDEHIFYVQFDVPPLSDSCGGGYNVTVYLQIYWAIPYQPGETTGSGTTRIGFICTPCHNINTKTFSYTWPSVAIPDDSESGVDMYLDVSDATAITDLEFAINGSACSGTPGESDVGLDHPDVHDLVLTLYSPQGTAVTLINRPGVSANGSNFCRMVLDDQANLSIQSITTDDAPYSGTFAPANPLAAFYGEDPNGTWVLNVSDRAAGNTGQVNAFSLVITDDSPECDYNYQSLSGRVTTNDTNALSGVTIKVVGWESQATSTDANGNYEFYLPQRSSYTVTPSKLGYLFTPASRYFSILDIDSTANFIATEANFGISGRVLIAGTTIGLSGATVTLTGDRTATITTGADGQYTFPNLPAGGNYTVTPHMIGYRFTPTTGSYSNLSAEQANQNFAARMQNYTVGGVVRLGTAGFGGVTVTLSSPTPDGFSTQTATTSSNGAYSFTNLPAGRNYTVTAAKTGYQLTPVSRTLTNLSANQTTVNFAVKVYTIGGVVKLGTNGLGGVSLTLTSPTLAGFTARTIMTGSTGAYSFTNVPAGHNYTVTPQKTGYQFTPASKSLTNLSANQTTVSFAVKVYSITGRVTKAGTTTVISAVTVTLTSPTPAGFATRTVQTTSTGTYTFTNVPAGRNYTIKPAKTGFTFTPATRSITNLSGNIGAGASTNFTGTQ